MSIITTQRKKPYTYSFSTGKKGPNGTYDRITGPYFATKKEAKAAEALAKAQYISGTYVKPQKLTVAEMLEKYVSTKVEIRITSKAPLRSFINRIKTQPIASKLIENVTVLDMEAYRAWLYEESGLSQQTIREELSFIRGAFTWAVDSDLLGKSPARRLKLPPKQPPKGLHLPMQIVLQILLMIKRNDYFRLYIPFLLGGLCGMRISETLAIPANVLDNDYIYVRNNLLREDGKMQLTPTKTPTSIRDIPIPVFVRREIQEYQVTMAIMQEAAIKRRQELLQAPGYIDTGEPVWKNELDLLIVFPDDGRPMRKDFVERRWLIFKKTNPEYLALVAEYPVLANMRHHDFRHSFGSNLRDKGVSIVDISDILGHADVSFTAKTYALPLKDTHKHAIDKFESAIKGLLY